MAKLNKVCTNIVQDFTDTEKARARTNIDASQIKYDNAVTDMTVMKETVRPYMNIKYTATIGSDNFLLLPGFFADGMVVKNNGSLQTQSIPQGLPSGGTAGQALIVDPSGNPVWAMPIQYSGGSGITETVDPHTGDIRFDWEYTVGRNLHINQNNAIQTNLPGGLYLAPTSYQNSFEVLSNDYGIAKFAGAFRLMCRKNSNDTYELAISYTASGTSSRITFIGTETIISTNNVITTNEAVYIGENSYYTPTNRFGGSASTPFDPSIHKAILYNGIANIGPTSDCKIAIWDDNGTVYVSFTAIEVSRVGSTL